MPEAFDKCVKDGGRVRTKKLEGKRYVHVCYIGGKAYRGHTKERKGAGSRLKKAAAG